MTFRLIQKSATAALAKFHIVNAAGDIVGSVNVPPNQVSNLFRNWVETKDSQGSSKQSPQSALAKAFLRNRKPISKQAVLRGCNG
jgi:hypothetical protein